jgi:hypothetical protein
MGQYNFQKHKTSGEAHKSPEWLPVSAAVGRMSNSWSGRGDLVAIVGPTAAHGNPALFDPRSTQVEVNSTVCFGAVVDFKEIGELDQREVQFDYPKATGAVFHEAMHARFSRWDIDDAASTLSPAVFNAMVLLEEGRIERHGLELFPANAGFLRTMALTIVTSDYENVLTSSDSMTAGNIAALALARVDAGSLESDDVAEIKTLIESKIGAHRVAALRDVWLKAQTYSAHWDYKGLIDLAKRWVEIIDEAAEENGEPSSEEAMRGRRGGAPSDADGELGEFAEAVAAALKEAAESAEVSGYTVLEDTRTLEEWEAQRRARMQDNKIEADSRSEASKVFGHGTGVVEGLKTNSTLVEKRQPTGPERATAVRVATLLEKAKYRDRSETEVTSVIPPGRLRTRAAVQGAALKSRGVMSQTEPWRRTVRKHTDDPTLNVGIMVDISGSMAAAMQPMATTAWVLSEAVRRVQGRAAMVYYGQDVFPTLKPGQHLDQVYVYSAPDMTEKFDRAFKALNGSLNLLSGTGARMLVVYSDGEYPSDETMAARKWLAACERAGVAVLWLCDSSSKNFGADRIMSGSRAVKMTVPTDTTSAAAEIGQAAAKALAAVC